MSLAAASSLGHCVLRCLLSVTFTLTLNQCALALAPSGVRDVYFSSSEMRRPLATNTGHDTSSHGAAAGRQQHSLPLPQASSTSFSLADTPPRLRSSTAPKSSNNVAAVDLATHESVTPGEKSLLKSLARRIDRRSRSSSRRRSTAPPSGLTVEEGLALVAEVTQRPRLGECDASEGEARPVLELSQSRFPTEWTKNFQNQTKRTVDTANVLNNLFQVWESNPTSLYNDAFFFSLAKGIVSGSDPLIVGATIAFGRDQYLRYSPGEPDGVPTSLAAHVRKPHRRIEGSNTSDGGELESMDLAELTKNRYTANGTAGYDWFWKQRKSFDTLWENQSSCSKAVTSEHEATTLTRVTSSEELGVWSAPYYDCQRADRWLLTHSVPFFGCNDEDQLLFKGVVAIDVALSNIDINQCEADDEEQDVTSRSYPRDAFWDTHKCRNSTKCVFSAGHGFQLGGYTCVCQDGFYSSSNHQHFSGAMVEEAYLSKLQNGSHRYDIGFHCLPCGRGCGAGCLDDSSCFVDYDNLIRAICIGIVSFCMSMCIVLGVVVIRMRKTKVMKASVWILLEVILFGSLLLYTTVIIQYFEPTDMTCIMIPWFREVGFAIVYGAIVLKIYRILSEFQSRKAHRVHVRDKDLLKYTLTIVILVVGFMASWTAVNMDYMINDNTSLVTLEQLDGSLRLGFYMCREMWWEYVVEAGEFFVLVFGIYLCYRIRSAPSEYKERRYLSLAIYNEAVVSTVTHIIRHFFWGILHPDYIFLMYFIRCQLTVSLCVILVLAPKLWYAHRPPEDDHFRNRTYSASDVQDNVLPESMKLHAGVNSNGDVDVTEINLTEMDPEDIRSELKRLYTQLQIYKTKTMRKDNPHISKRRGGRKQTHRRFSLQAFHHKHKHHHDHDHDHEMSKTPEESTNSAEGVAYSIEESVCSMGEVSEKKTPTVTFKPGHKSFY